MKLRVTEQMIFVAAGAVAAGIINRQVSKKVAFLSQPVVGGLLALPAFFLYNPQGGNRQQDLNLILLGLMAGGLASGLDGINGIPQLQQQINGPGNRPVQINFHK
jgi:hypothetical protein